MAARVCVIGSTNVDLIVRVEHLPRLGETIVGHDFSICFGGKGANQAVAAARLGAEVDFISRVGNDVFGTQALENLRRHGVATAGVSVDGERPTGVASIAVDAAAQNAIVVAPGANLGLTPAIVRAAADVIRAADVVVCQLEVPLESVLEALQIARAAGVRTILNPAPALPQLDDLWPLTDLAVPNETELAALTGASPRTTQDIAAAATCLQRQGVRDVVVTLGARGALIVNPVEVLPPPPLPAVDSTGAGDAFIGALAVFLVEGLTLREAVRRANAAAALSVTRLGTQTAQPTRAEVDALLQHETDAGPA
jgi:ribokinase